MRFRSTCALLAVIVAGVILIPGASSAGAAGKGPKINAAIASFDPYAGTDQRFIVGLVAKDNRLLAYGQVRFRFGYAGTRDQPIKQVTAGLALTARYLPIPGQDIDDRVTTARLVAPSKSRGVYGVDAARFDRPGYWVVLVSGKNGKQPFTTSAFFEVASAPQVVAVGQPAPHSTNPLPGATGIPPRAIDSRADRGPVPDPELHNISVADALATGKPLMVVVSTPVYCVSQFCGPITDSIQKLARQYGARMNFVHLEVWRDFQTKQVNDAAGQWVRRRDNNDANEPWVFVVDRNGIVSQRFDNVATEQELQDAIHRQVP